MKYSAKRRAQEAEDGISSGRHPLNSERRRANRRKPGKAGLMAARKKKEKVSWRTNDTPVWFLWQLLPFTGWISGDHWVA